jgi:hypothetical protein
MIIDIYKEKSQRDSSVRCNYGLGLFAEARKMIKPILLKWGAAIHCEDIDEKHDDSSPVAWSSWVYSNGSDSNFPLIEWKLTSDGIYDYTFTTNNCAYTKMYTTGIERIETKCDLITNNKQQ